MNPGALGAFVTAHKKELLAGGAGVAVVGGLYARSKATAASTAATTTIPGAPMPNASGTGYDSSASDVYNAIQPQIETTQTQLGQTQTMVQTLMDQLTAAAAAAGGSSTPPPVNVVPVNAAPDAPPPARVTPPAPYHLLPPPATLYDQQIAQRAADNAQYATVDQSQWAAQTQPTGSPLATGWEQGTIVWVSPAGQVTRVVDNASARMGIAQSGGTIVG